MILWLDVIANVPPVSASSDCEGSPRISLKRYRWVYPSGTIIDGYQSCSAVPLSTGFIPMGQVESSVVRIERAS